MVNNYRQLPCIADNHSYDLGLVLKEMEQDLRINIHVKKGLKFYSVKIDERFIDRCAFMSASLSSLAKSHIDSRESLYYNKRLIQHVPAKAQELLLTGKQYFPCEYINTIERLRETSLPS